MKTNIKMRVTPEQSKRVQEICFENKIFWIVSKNTFCDYPLIYIKPNVLVADADHEDDFEEIDADLFIRTNGTCEEDELKNFIQSQNEIKDGINEWAKQFNDIDNLKAENIGMGKLVNLSKSALDLAVITKELAMNEIERKNNEIEKLKAVIEYLESKVK